MIRTFLRGLWVFGAVFLLYNCDGVVTDEGFISFEELLTQGWAAFESGDYNTASAKFLEAKILNLNKTEGYTGLGWSYFKRDSLEKAIGEFRICSNLNDPSADLYAGWAFVLNALNQHAESNEKVIEAFKYDSVWVFTYGLGLDASDLYLLQAENYLLLGLFSESLASVRLVNASFNANILTDEGKAALAAEIERLKGDD